MSRRRQTMKTIIEIPTLGDTSTQPGGIALRYRETTGEFIVHNYNTDKETSTDRHYWQGSYFTTGTEAERFVKALDELTRRAERACRYDLGGALDLGKLLGFPFVPGLVDASGALDMAQAMREAD